MTAAAGPVALPGGAAPAAQPVVPLRDDLVLAPGTPGAAGCPSWVIHDPVRNKFFNIGWLQYEFLQRWSMTAPERIAQSVSAETTLDARTEDVVMLSEFLARNELIRPGQAAPAAKAGSGSGTALWSFILHKYLFFRIPLFHPDRFLAATLPLAKPFFSRGFRNLVMIIALLGGYLVIRQWNTFSQALVDAMSLEGAIYFLVALVLSKCLHELGHAYTCKRYGLYVPTMGVAFLVMWPFLYTDTTESWKLRRRRQRIAIGIAGVYIELCLAAFATLAWGFLADGPLRDAAFFLASAGWVMTLAINANPLMRWDGYYVLSDLLAVDNLQSRAFALGRWHLRECLFGLADSAPDVVGGNKRRSLILWAYCTWLYRLILFIGIALLVYHFFFKALGIVLMTVEIVWFIARPVSSELQVWFERRADFRWNRHSLITTVALLSSLLLLAYPWTREVALPAVAKPALYKSFFAPVPAQVASVGIEVGHDVTSGQLLLHLHSPDLVFRLRQVGNDIALYRASLARQGRRDLLEQRDVSRRRLLQSLTAEQGLRQEWDQLSMFARFSGQVVSVSEDLRPGRWLRGQEKLVTIMDRSSLTLHGYVAEDQLGRIQGDAKGRFYPDDPRLPAVEVLVTNVDSARSHLLSDLELASDHGGPIAVNHGESGPAPLGSVYRVGLRFAPDQAPVYDTVVRGVVRIEAQPESALERIWRRLGAVLIRESGF